jgi:MYXO-CTERM domain-containing protein
LQKSTLAVATLAVALGISSARVQAQSSPDATCTLVMPSGTDPTRLTVIQPNILYTKADGTIPGDQLGSPLTGNLLLTAAFSGGGGLELHADIPSGTSSIPMKEVDFYTDYAGNLGLNSAVGSAFANTPWNFQTLRTVPTGFVQGFRFFEQSGSADINKGEFYGVLSATLGNSSDPTGFRNASFAMTGFTQVTGTPEPGALALVAAMGLAIAVRVRQRRRK